MLFNSFYYQIKPLIPRYVQILLRRWIVLNSRSSYRDIWPIDPDTSRPPDGWAQWPNQKRFALVLTHDVDTEKGYEKCIQLSKIEEDSGFRSSFNFVPERYDVSSELRQYLGRNGFEVGVHGLNHDGRLYSSKKVFQERAIRINRYLSEWGCVGFRSPAMHHNLDWIQDLDVEYDASTFDTDPFEPQSDGVGTIFPFWVHGDGRRVGYVELPYTLPQDFTLFIIMKEKGVRIWREKIDWIAQEGGMALLNTHPDYMNFDRKKPGLEEYPAEYYTEFLEYIRDRYKGEYWHALPRDLARFWSQSMKPKKN